MILKLDQCKSLRVGGYCFNWRDLLSLIFWKFVMKVASSLKTLKNRHPDCKVVRRKGRLYVINKTNPRFKARQGWLTDFCILQMKKDIHPVLNPVSFVDVSTGKKFNTVSTASSKKTENIDGVDHHILVRDITLHSLGRSALLTLRAEWRNSKTNFRASVPDLF